MKRLFLLTLVLAPVLTFSQPVSVLSTAATGDTLPCFISSNDGEVHYDRFIFRTVGITINRPSPSAAHAAHYLVVEEKKDSIVYFSLYRKNNHTLITKGAYITTTDGRILRSGIWEWYDDREQPAYLETYVDDQLQTKEKRLYDERGLLEARTLYEFYTDKSFNNKSPFRFKILSPSGELKTMVQVPRERVKNNSGGVLVVKPTTSVYYQADEEVQLVNEQKIRNAVQRFVQKNHDCPRLKNAMTASYSFDVMVRTDTDGNIFFIMADTQYTYIDFVASDMTAAHNEWRNFVLPKLKQYLENELPSKQTKGAPAMVGKIPVEAYLYLTITINLKTSI